MVLHCHTAWGLSVYGPMLKIKVQEFAKKLNYDGFQATDSWLAHWKSRKQIQFKKAHGEKS